MITGTSISSVTGDTIDPNNIDIAPVSDDVKIKANKYNAKKNKVAKKGGKAESNETMSSEVFEFGIPGTHLIFSSPVSISIATPMYSDGITVDIAVLHSGNADFNTSGLSTARDTLCNTDGSASKSGSQAVVKNGKITFYTCGASSFTMNPSGGTTGSNDLRIIIGDCAQAQVYYNNLAQVVGGNPPATGCTGPSTWPVLRIGTTNYGNGYSAWKTATTTSSINGNIYTATSNMTARVGGRTYSLIIDWSHTAPNKYFTWSYKVIVPSGNSANIKLYYAMNSSVAGNDANDMGYYTNTGGQTVGVSDTVGNIVSAFRYLSGAVWTGYEADPFGTLQTNITNGANFNNVIQSGTGDLGFGVNWDFGTAASVTYSGAVEWRVMPYVATNVVDLIPGIGQPSPVLAVGITSQLPITLTNVGNMTSTGVHTVVLTLPANISGPSSGFTSNGWSCGAVSGTTVTCTKTTTMAFLASDTLSIPVVPLPPAGGTSVTFNIAISNIGDSNTSNNSAFATNAVVAATPYAPGGVRSMTFWTKADGGKNCSTNGCTITSWTNSGTLGAAANAVTGLGTVTYDTTNQINYNPTLYFNNASLNTNSSLNLTTISGSVYTVTRIASGGSFLIGPQTVVTNSLDWSTTPTADKF